MTPGQIEKELQEALDSIRGKQMQDTGDTLEASGPLGIRVRTTGNNVSMMVFIAIIAAGLSYMGWYHHESGTKSDQIVVDQLKEMIYILQLSPQERESLNLHMPDSLRQKLINGK